MANFNITVNKKVNQPPSQVGDGAASTNWGVPIVFTKDMLTSQLVPPYQDPENDEPANIKFTQVPSIGELQLNGVTLVNNDIVSFADIENGLLSYVPDNSQETLVTPSFQFEISDEGSNTFVG